MGLACTIATECVLQKGDIDDQMAIGVGRPRAMDALDNVEMAAVSSGRYDAEGCREAQGVCWIGCGRLAAAGNWLSRRGNAKRGRGHIEARRRRIASDRRGRELAGA